MKALQSRPWMALFLLGVLGAAGASAAESEGVEVDITLAADQDSKPAANFAADAPQVMAFFTSSGSKKGDSIHGILVAEDVGKAAPAGTTVVEDTITCPKTDCSGNFKFSKPTKGWPEGDYKVEIYWNGELAASADFTVGDEDEE